MRRTATPASTLPTVSEISIARGVGQADVELGVVNWELKSVCLNLRPRRADYVMQHQWWFWDSFK